MSLFSIHVDVYLCVHVLMCSIRVNARVRVHAHAQALRISNQIGVPCYFGRAIKGSVRLCV